ncbi:MAG: pyruvate kinase alpha/beta domain-containing protein [Candidatus Bathyarchaeia archaeon]
MERVQVTYFEKTSDEDPEGITKETLKLAKKRGDELGIKSFVVASSTGFVAKKALALLADTSLILVGGARDWYEKDFLKELERKGVPTLFSHEVRYSYPADVQSAYRRMSEGAKVCPEIVMLAADRGLIPPGVEVIAIAGTGSGADTAMVILSAKSKAFKELKIREVICKPR